MDERIDKDTEEMLMKALENAKAFGQQLAESREKRLWKEVNIPCSLHEAVNGLTKDEMDKIRKTYDFKNLSALKKSAMAAELARLIPQKFKRAIFALDKGRYDFIRMLLKNSGVMQDKGISVSKAEAFMKYSMVFTGIYEDEKVLYLPSEIKDIFIQTDSSELERLVRRNTEWIRLTQGMLYNFMA